MVGLGSLRLLLGLLCLVLCGRLCSACLWGLMDDENSSHYIFLFMLLLIPFHVIGLSIKTLLVHRNNPRQPTTTSTLRCTITLEIFNVHFARELIFQQVVPLLRIQKKGERFYDVKLGVSSV